MEGWAIALAHSSGLYEFALELGTHVIADRHSDRDFFAELGCEVLGQQLALVLVVLGRPHHCLSVDSTNSLDIGVSCSSGGENTAELSTDEATAAFVELVCTTVTSVAPDCVGYAAISWDDTLI